MIAPWLLAPWQQLQARRSAGRLPHALLLAAPAGLGQLEFAQALVHGLLCEHNDAQGFACGHCRGCKLLAAGSHPDYRFITLELNDQDKLRKEIVIEQIRHLCEQSARTSHFGGHRLALIDPADKLNHNAANALLKTLEEPDENAVFLLLSEQPSRLPATIRSRCQRITIPLPSHAQALAWLTAEGVPADAAQAALVLADGNPGEAKALATPAVQDLLRDLIEDVAALADGRALTPVLGRWNDEQAALRLRSLARLLTAALRAGSGDDRSEIARLRGLLAGADFNRLSAAWDRINWVCGQLDSTLRRELLLVDAASALRAAWH
ncbi:MAG: DNA polymerase III subunit delta' [Lysobacterales bacterium]